jgi:Peptidase family S41/PDZ domain
MKNLRYLIFVFALLLALTFAIGPAKAATGFEGGLAADVLSNLSIMKTVYQSEYAPAAWKKQYAGYDLETEYAKAVSAAQGKQKMTIADSREIFKNFIYAMKDYHTSIKFVSTEMASLPLTIRGAGDHFFIAAIDRAKLSAATFPFKEGDEVVTFGGQPTVEAVKAVQAQITENVPGTDRGLAEARLTVRSANRGILVPQGPVTLGIQRQGETQVREIQLLWDYTPEKVNPRNDILTGVDLLSPPASIFRPQMDVDVMDRKVSDAAGPFDMGARKSFIPALGAKIWESAEDSIFYAYIYQTADRKLVGYVRIPGYTTPDYVKAVAEFAKIIERFESTTDSMVIDQVNNPGGSVFYLYTLASMLTDRPLVTPLHRMSITQADVAESLETIEKFKDVASDEDAKKVLPESELNGYPASYEFVKFMVGFAQFIVSEWNQGHKLSAPYWIGGVDHINPAPVHYSKPILILINHLDFSGGDFFPTIMQDNRRATILGSRTAGAGGYVLDVKVPNNVGVASFRFTGSIAERVNGRPIENLGVTPDIPYELTSEDYTTGFQPYLKTIRAAVGGLR